MTGVNFIENLFTPAGFYSLIGIAVKALLVVYVVFAFIVIRQLHLMNNSFKTPFALPLTFVSWVHFFISLGLLGLAFSL